MSPAFSIIIPVYNVAPYLRECLDSVLVQTFTDWECICIDDGSTDGSGEILDEYAAADGRFKIIHQKNSGVEKARNAGFGKSIGQRIIFFDGDDLLPKDYLFAHCKAIENENSNAVTYSSYISKYDDEFKKSESANLFKSCASVQDFVEAVLRERWCPIIHGWTWPREIIEKGGIWREDIVANDDLEFAFRHLVLAPKVVFVDYVNAIYRKHLNGLSHMTHDLKYFEGVLAAARAREYFALELENTARMRFAVAQLWYSLLLDRDIMQKSFVREFLLEKINYYGNPDCLIVAYSSKQGRCIRYFGIRNTIRLCRINYWLKDKLGMQ